MLKADGTIESGPHALKDIWVEHGQRREGDVPASIVSAAEAYDGPNPAEVRAAIKNYIYKIIVHGEVLVPQHGLTGKDLVLEPDSTLRIRHGNTFDVAPEQPHLILASELAALYFRDPSAPLFPCFGGLPDSHARDTQLRELHHKFRNLVHYRLVSADVGQSFKELQRPHDGLQAAVCVNRGMLQIQSPVIAH